MTALSYVDFRAKLHSLVNEVEDPISPGAKRFKDKHVVLVHDDPQMGKKAHKAMGVKKVARRRADTTPEQQKTMYEAAGEIVKSGSLSYLNKKHKELGIWKYDMITQKEWSDGTRSVKFVPKKSTKEDVESLQNEAVQQLKGDPLKAVVKILRGPEFKWNDPKGQNAMKSGDTIWIRDYSYFNADWRHLKSKMKEWEAGGTYAKYFKDKYGISFKIADSGITPASFARKDKRDLGDAIDIWLKVVDNVREDLDESFKVGDKVARNYTSSSAEYEQAHDKKNVGVVKKVSGSGENMKVTVNWGRGDIDYLPLNKKYPEDKLRKVNEQVDEAVDCSKLDDVQLLDALNNAKTAKEKALIRREMRKRG